MKFTKRLFCNCHWFMVLLAVLALAGPAVAGSTWIQLNPTGIATESDIVRFRSRALGIREEGSRITIEGLGGKLTELEKIISIASQHKTIVLSMISLPRPEKKDWKIVLRLKTGNPDPIVKDFKKAGLNVTYASWFRCETGLTTAQA